MKKLALFLAVMLASVCQAQQAAITAQTQDPDGINWVGGSYTITLGPIPTGTTPTRIDNGQNVSPTSFQGTLDSTGSFSVTLTSINNIRPSGLSWKITVCPNVSSGNCGTISILANASGSVSTQLNAVLQAPRIGGGIGAYAYADVEVAATANNSYFNVGTSTPGCRYYGSSWGGCGSSSGGVTAVTGTSPIVSSGGTTPAISCPTCGVGTVTAVSIATANGVSGTSSGGATPALTISLGAINPTSVGATTTGPGIFSTLTVPNDTIHANYWSLAGNTANFAVVANTWGFMGPAETTYSGWAEQPANSTSGGPTAGQIKIYGATSGAGVSTFTFGSTPEASLSATGFFGNNTDFPTGQQIIATVATNAGHFTNLTIINTFHAATCTTAPTINVFDGAVNVGTAKIASATLQGTRGTVTTQTQTQTFAAGDVIGVYVSTAGGTCLTDIYSVSAQYSEP